MSSRRKEKKDELINSLQIEVSSQKTEVKNLVTKTDDME